VGWKPLFGGSRSLAYGIYTAGVSFFGLIP
jgi:hypothetical protein